MGRTLDPRPSEQTPSRFEEHIAQLARDRGCVGVMCGHIHTPADKMIAGIHYLNSGDWVETLTAIVEHWDGRYALIDYPSFLRQFPAPDEEPAEEPAQDAVGARQQAGAFSPELGPGA